MSFRGFMYTYVYVYPYHEIKSVFSSTATRRPWSPTRYLFSAGAHRPSPHPPPPLHGCPLENKKYQVYATAHSFLPQLEKAGVKDSAHCLFTFPSGAVFSLEMTRCSAYGYDNRIEASDEQTSNIASDNSFFSFKLSPGNYRAFSLVQGSITTLANTRSTYGDRHFEVNQHNNFDSSFSPEKPFPV